MGGTLKPMRAPRPARVAHGLAYLPTACVVSLLPRPWREATSNHPDHHLLPGAVVTSLAEAGLGFAVLFYVTILAGVHALEGLRDPWVLVCGAVGLEGAFRFGGVLTGRVVGSVPFWAIWALGFGARHGHRRLRARRLAPDRLVRTDTGLEIDTGTPRDWHETTTLEIEGAFYRVVRESRWDDPERPHRYHLEPVPAGWLIRRLEPWPAPPDGDPPAPDQSSTKV